MQTKIIQNFLGEINGVQIFDTNIYNSTVYILDNIESKFGEIYSNEFVSDLVNTITEIYLKYDNFSFDTLENCFIDGVNKASTFNEIYFEYLEEDWKIIPLNENISNGKYLLQNDLEVR